jgi:hypothetical protein
MQDVSEADSPFQREIDRLEQALASVDSGDFYGAYDEAEVAVMRTSLQRLRRALGRHQAHPG